MVLNLIGGTEPCKLHQCSHRTLRNWKNNMLIWFKAELSFVSFIHVNPYCRASSNCFLFLEPTRTDDDEDRQMTDNLYSSQVDYKVPCSTDIKAKSMGRDQLQPMMAKRSVMSRLFRVGCDLYTVIQSKFGAWSVRRGKQYQEGEKILAGGKYRIYHQKCWIQFSLLADIASVNQAIVCVAVTPAEPLRVTLRTPRVRLNPA